MDSFDIDRYFDMLRMRGYEVNPRYDTTNCKLVGYTIGKNASVFKASAIGRKFMVSQLEATWKKMHPKPTQVKMRPASPSVSPGLALLALLLRQRNLPSPILSHCQLLPRLPSMSMLAVK